MEELNKIKIFANELTTNGFNEDLGAKIDSEISYDGKESFADGKRVRSSNYNTILRQISFMFNCLAEAVTNKLVLCEVENNICSEKMGAEKESDDDSKEYVVSMKNVNNTNYLSALIGAGDNTEELEKYKTRLKDILQTLFSNYVNTNYGQKVKKSETQTVNIKDWLSSTEYKLLVNGFIENRQGLIFNIE